MGNDTAEWLKKVSVKKENNGVSGVSFTCFEDEEGEGGIEHKEQLFTKAPKANVMKKSSYGSKDLRGLKVSHDIEDFKAGQSDILVLADMDVLNESSQSDTLISMSVRDQERLKRLREVERHSKGYSGYKEFEEQDFSEDSVFTIGGGPQRKKILQKYDFNLTEEFKDEPELNSSFILGNEVISSSSSNKTESQKSFDTVKMAGVDNFDLSSISNKRKTVEDIEKARKRAKRLTKSLFSDEPEMKVDFEERSVVHTGAYDVDYSTEQNEELDDFDMQRIISATRKGKLSLRSQNENITQAAEPASTAEGISFDSFMTLGIQDLQEQEQEIMKPDSTQKQQESFDYEKEEALIENQDSFFDQMRAYSESENFVLSAEPLVRNGVASTLALLNMKGINLRPKSSKKGIHNNDLSSVKSSKTNFDGSDIKLEYFDQFGNKLNTKEAYKELSRKFHGKGPGKSKLKKMKRKREETRRIEEAPVSESSAHSALVTNLRTQQQHTGEAHMVISNTRTLVTAVESTQNSVGFSENTVALEKRKLQGRKIFGLQGQINFWMNLHRIFIFTAFITSSIVESSAILSKSKCLRSINSSLPKTIFQNQATRFSSTPAPKNSNSKNKARAIFALGFTALSMVALDSRSKYSSDPRYNDVDRQLKSTLIKYVPAQIFPTKALNYFLFSAVAKGDAEEVKYLISMGADVNCRNGFKYTPLLSAIYNSQYEIAYVLIIAGAQTSFEISSVSFDPKSLLNELLSSDKIYESNPFKDDLVRLLCHLSYISNGVFDAQSYFCCISCFSVNDDLKISSYDI